MEKINIAELLKDCPSGMELDSTLFDDIYFDCIDNVCDIIKCYIQESKHKIGISFDKYGHYSNISKSKCVIFPKGKTTWEGFVPPCQFKDGDVVTNIQGAVIIYKKITTSGYCGSFVSLDHYNKFIPHYESYLTDTIRLATEEEKEKLFDAIKANGYKWNEETKTLEEMIESKEDKKTKGYCTEEPEDSGKTKKIAWFTFWDNDFADEVELYLKDRELVQKDSKWFVVKKNSSQVNLKELERKLDEALEKETKESLEEFFFGDPEPQPKAPILSNRYDYAEGKCGYVIPDGYEFDYIKEGFQTEIILKPKKPTYPKDYKECCRIIDYYLTGATIIGYEKPLLENLQRLLICRDAYWKIAGKEMGLDKPWKPDFTNNDEERYGIYTLANKVEKDFCGVGDVNMILVFPAEEMRNTFYENFKDLIEQCKELL